MGACTSVKSMNPNVDYDREFLSIKEKRKIIII